MTYFQAGLTTEKVWDILIIISTYDPPSSFSSSYHILKTNDAGGT